MLRFPAFFLAPLFAAAQNLSPLEDTPDWTELDAFHETMTRAEFVRQLDTIYAPRGAARGLVDLGDDEVRIVEALGQPARRSVQFARDASTTRKAPRYWRTRGELGPAPAEKPLAGMRIALDPGHLGGGYARMEGRWFRIGDSAPVCEGDLTLAVARHLAPRLAALGAEVLWVRSAPGPVTALRPADFFSIARGLLAAQGHAQPRETYDSFDDRARGNTVQFQAEHLFFLQMEIRDRARLVNHTLKPDLVLCLHFNADAWGRDDAPDFARGQHFHVLVNGCATATEMRLDDQRHEVLHRLLSGIAPEEARLATQVAQTFARMTALPPYVYSRAASAVRVNDSPYVWARNLLANRLYRCPVVFLEPYVMNCRETWERVQAGDYEGERSVAGSVRRSLVREYADAVAAGLAEAMR